MAGATKPITKVWIVEGCIVCDACATECPEVFDVRESSCVVRPEADNVQFLLPLAEKILKAADACPTSVIKHETGEITAVAAAPAPKTEMPGPALEAPAAKPAAKAADARPPAAKPAAEKPTAKPAKPAPPPKPKIVRKEPGDLPDPLLQAIAETSRLPASRGAAGSEAERAVAAITAAQIPADAPPDMRAAILAAGGAYAPKATLEQQIKASKGRMLWHKLLRRKVNVQPAANPQR
ncbi:MAG: ferredoxin [Tepidisphaeraceae bacterium]|jgi:ferredoxin